MSDANKLWSIHAGFIPLVDAAPLILAKELGFDAQEGVALHLHREVSWANIRDKVNVGRFDVAHMLAPMPLAATLGIGHIREELLAPVTLSFNGNAITVSNAVFEEMRAADPEGAAAGGRAAGLALGAAIRMRSARGAGKLTLGVVYPFSCHAYELRFWLAQSGVDPDTDVDIVVLPPSLMAESVSAGHIQGFCAGEPWNSVAVESGVGRIVATKAELWGAAPEKVLGVRAAWAASHAEALDALIRALASASAWIRAPLNQASAAEILARPEYLDLPPDIVSRAFRGCVRREPAAGDAPPPATPGFVRFDADGEIRASRLHALWLLTQMARWGELSAAVDLAALAEWVCAPSIYARATGAPAALTTEADRCVAENSGLAFEGLREYLAGFPFAASEEALQRLAQAQPES